MWATHTGVPLQVDQSLISTMHVIMYLVWWCPAGQHVSPSCPNNAKVRSTTMWLSHPDYSKSMLGFIQDFWLGGRGGIYQRHVHHSLMRIWLSLQDLKPMPMHMQLLTLSNQQIWNEYSVSPCKMHDLTCGRKYWQ